MLDLYTLHNVVPLTRTRPQKSAFRVEKEGGGCHNTWGYGGASQSETFEKYNYK